jgi:hypothetical protein
MELTFFTFWQGLSFLAGIFVFYILLIFWEMNSITINLLGRSIFYLPLYVLKDRKNVSYDTSFLESSLEEIRSLLEEDEKQFPMQLESVQNLLWQKVDGFSYFHINSLNGHVYALILWGFTGTLYGAMSSFHDLANAFGDSQNPGDVIQQTLGGGLSLALISSLAASIIGAVVILIRRFLLLCVSDYEHHVQMKITSLYRDLKTGRKKEITTEEEK